MTRSLYLLVFLYSTEAVTKPSVANANMRVAMSVDQHGAVQRINASAAESAKTSGSITPLDNIEEMGGKPSRGSRKGGRGGDGDDDDALSGSVSTSERAPDSNVDENTMKMYSDLRFSAIRIQCVVVDTDLMRPYVQGGGGDGEHKFVGTGFVVRNDEDGPLIVTNAHVVLDAAAVKVQVTANGQQQYAAKVVLVNPDWDIALVQVKDKSLQKLKQNLDGTKIDALSMYDGKVSLGMDVVTMGFPLGQTSVKVTKGVLSGHEVVGGFVVYQQTAPISPGNSGGPLFVAGTEKVLGINFASSVGYGSQNNNYAIPAWRVTQMLTAYEEAVRMGGSKESGPYDPTKCSGGKSPESCAFHIPEAYVKTLDGDEDLHGLYGCDKGTFITKVAKVSFFAQAEPPIEDHTFITHVNGFKLDDFGMGTNADYIEDPVHFVDLIYMNKDLSKGAEVTTCKCGKETKHTLSLQYTNANKPGVGVEDQPSLTSVDYETFGDLTIRPLSINLAQEILMTGDIEIAKYATDPDLPPVLVVSDVGKLKQGNKERSINAGSVVKAINGKKVNTLKKYRKAFIPTSGSKDSENVGACTTQAADDYWTLTTMDGGLYVAHFDDTLKNMVANDENREGPPLTIAAKRAAIERGLIGGGDDSPKKRKRKTKKDTGSKTPTDDGEGDEMSTDETKAHASADGDSDDDIDKKLRTWSYGQTLAQEISKEEADEVVNQTETKPQQPMELEIAIPMGSIDGRPVEEEEIVELRPKSDELPVEMRAVRRGGEHDNLSARRQMLFGGYQPRL